MKRLMGGAVQWGIVARDIQAAMRHWIEVYGAGPFFFIPRLSGPGRSLTYRGLDTGAEISVAFSYYQGIQIELIQQLNSDPSPYLDFLAKGQEGLQHIGVWSEQFPEAFATLTTNGYRPVYIVRAGGIPHDTTYFESPGSLGVMLELSLMTPARKARYRAMQHIVENWAGDEPVRTYESIDALGRAVCP